MKMNALEWIAFVLVMIGALNWGLVGIGGWMGSPIDLVAITLGSIPFLQNLVYVLVGLSAVVMIVSSMNKK